MYSMMISIWIYCNWLIKDESILSSFSPKGHDIIYPWTNTLLRDAKDIHYLTATTYGVELGIVDVSADCITEAEIVSERGETVKESSRAQNDNLQDRTETKKNLAYCTTPGTANFLRSLGGASIALFNVPKLVPGTAYEFRIRARAGAVFGKWSSVLVSRTRNSVPDKVAGIFSSHQRITSSSIDILWVPPASNGCVIEAYNIEMRKMSIDENEPLNGEGLLPVMPGSWVTVAEAAKPKESEELKVGFASLFCDLFIQNYYRA